MEVSDKSSFRVSIAPVAKLLSYLFMDEKVVKEEFLSNQTLTESR
jgi:hypothetical protein